MPAFIGHFPQGNHDRIGAELNRIAYIPIGIGTDFHTIIIKINRIIIATIDVNQDAEFSGFYWFISPSLLLSLLYHIMGHMSRGF